MQASKSQWQRVSKAQPCPICEKPNWCSVSSEGTVACCMRIESDKPCKGDGGGWIHRLKETISMTPRRMQPTKKRLTDAEQHAKFAPLARSFFRRRGNEVVMLAGSLGVASWALDALMVGYGQGEDGRCFWTFPERSPSGLILGVNRRWLQPVDGLRQQCMAGSRRGLTYIDDWDDYPGPVLIVEGGSDTAAGLTLGRAVIGRPSCAGGAKALVNMLRPLPADRRIIVVAERDRKQHADLPPAVKKRHSRQCRGCMLCWPGKAGARDLAKRLSRELRRRVIWLLPPDGAKDLRGWLSTHSYPLDVNNTDATFALGKEVLR